jgi:RimJ/RimL family protein N-acetyltransferase
MPKPMTYLFAPERYETTDFVLRSYDVGDGPLLSDASDESYDHLRPWMPWATPHQSVADSEKLVRQFRARYLLSEDFVIGIFSTDEKRLLGGAGFHLREGPIATGCAEIGMFIRKNEAGRGLGTRVLLSLLDWGFSAWPWLRLSWRCDQRNLASIRVAEKAGLLHEGTLRGQQVHVGEGRRNTVCYALTKPDWLDRPRTQQQHHA